jgi:hypothetical protein
VPGPTDPFGTSAYRSLELSNAGSSMLRWALAIGPGSKWRESRVERRGDQGFQLQAWNRLPQATPTLKVLARDIGLKGEQEVLQVELSGPAYRQPAEFEVAWTANQVSMKVSKPGKIRLFYRVLRPEWRAQEKLVLERRGPGGRAEVASGKVAWEKDAVEWEVTPGEYDLHRVSR